MFVIYANVTPICALLFLFATTTIKRFLRFNIRLNELKCRRAINLTHIFSYSQKVSLNTFAPTIIDCHEIFQHMYYKNIELTESRISELTYIESQFYGIRSAQRDYPE